MLNTSALIYFVQKQYEIFFQIQFLAYHQFGNERGWKYLTGAMQEFCEDTKIFCNSGTGLDREGEGPLLRYCLNCIHNAAPRKFSQKVSPELFFAKKNSSKVSASLQLSWWRKLSEPTIANQPRTSSALLEKQRWLRHKTGGPGPNWHLSFFQFGRGRSAVLPRNCPLSLPWEHQRFMSSKKSEAKPSQRRS